jgi:hypothetical protein
LIFPIIKPSPLEVTIVQYEARLAGDNQLHLGGGAQPGDVAGILRNFRFD